MSKKIMKRSLALGALMAFVITGSAWASIQIGNDVNGYSDLDTDDIKAHIHVEDGQNLKISGVTISGGSPKYNNVIGVEGSTELLNTTIKSCSPKGSSKTGVVEVYEGGTLKLKGGVVFMSNGHNAINNRGTVEVSGKGNKINGYDYRGIYNYGELIFESDSDTEFSNGNGRDISNRNGGSITVKEGATVTFKGSGIDLDTGTCGYVNLMGSVNGNIGGNNIVRFSNSGVLTGSMVEGFNAKKTVSTGFCEVEFNGGKWNVTGDSTVAEIAVNGDSTIDGTDGLGSTGDKPELTVNRKITNNTEYLIEHKSGTLTINNVKIDGVVKNTSVTGKGNASGRSYGSVYSGYSTGGGSLVITNSEISNNKNGLFDESGNLVENSSYHYAIIDAYKGVTIKKTKFENNLTDYMGGVLYLHGNVSTIENSEFIGNTAAQGAAIQSNGAKITLMDSIFKNNIATKDGDGDGDCGGAICAQGASEITFEGKNTFDANKASGANGNGGAIAQYKGAQTANTIIFAEGSSTEFKNNTANGNGGAIWNGVGGVIEVNGELNFTGNIADGKGNDIYNIGTLNINQGAKVKLDGGIDGTGTTNIEGGTLELGGNNRIGILKVSDGGKIAFGEKGHLDVDEIDESSDIVTITMVGKDADDLNTKDQLTTVAERMGVAENYKATDKVKVVMAEGDIVGETTGEVVFETKATEGGVDYYHGVVKNVIESANPANEALSNAGIGMKLHNRAHMNDMNKRLGELRDANGDLGVWTRMVRGESEYKNVKAQYNQYQLGYDEKLSVDNRWTVGAAVTFAEGDASYGYGSTEDKSTAFAIYGSKLNNDGTFVDLIARYARLESDVDDQAGKGDLSANSMSVSAEFGKRIQQGNGLWIEPQVELTYGTLEDAEMQLGGKTVQVGDMDSLIGRVGFRIGQDIEKGNVYARASYLYDFDGETETSFTNGTATRYFKDDLGGGWWEVGVGANINLSKATYIYADVEKTFGGEVDTNWQWNLGVRYSF